VVVLHVEMVSGMRHKASLHRGLEARIWRWISSGRLGIACVWPWCRTCIEVASSVVGCIPRQCKGTWSVVVLPHGGFPGAGCLAGMAVHGDEEKVV
jgi:hypothetical protein